MNITSQYLNCQSFHSITKVCDKTYRHARAQLFNNLSDRHKSFLLLDFFVPIVLMTNVRRNTWEECVPVSWRSLSPIWPVCRQRPCTPPTLWWCCVTSPTVCFYRVLVASLNWLKNWSLKWTKIMFIIFICLCFVICLPLGSIICTFMSKYLNNYRVNDLIENPFLFVAQQAPV